MSVDIESRIRAKIAGRELCEQIMLLVAGEVRDVAVKHGQAAAESFWENFRTAFEGHFPRPAAPESADEIKPMDDFEAKQFEKQPLSFGQHKGRRIADIPKGYLEWLAYQEDDLKEQIKRYLANDRVRSEPNENDDEE